MTDPKNAKATAADNNRTGPQPDPETLHTTDPQEHMEGPVSSAMHKAGETFDTGESQEEADQEKREAGI